MRFIPCEVADTRVHCSLEPFAGKAKRVLAPLVTVGLIQVHNQSKFYFTHHHVQDIVRSFMYDSGEQENLIILSLFDLLPPLYPFSPLLLLLIHA